MFKHLQQMNIFRYSIVSNGSDFRKHQMRRG